MLVVKPLPLTLRYVLSWAYVYVYINIIQRAHGTVHILVSRSKSNDEIEYIFLNLPLQSDIPPISLHNARIESLALGSRHM